MELSEKYGLLLAVKELSSFNPIIEQAYFDLPLYNVLVTMQIKSQITKCEEKYNIILKNKQK